MPDTWIERSFEEPYLTLRCACGWEGYDRDIERWDVQADRDRVVRQCPSCGRVVPEWGTLRPIDGLTEVARGPLRSALVEGGHIEEE